MPKLLPKRTCPTCAGDRVKKNGTTKAGTSRYRCLDCGASHTAKRPASSRAHTFETFVDYVVSKHSIKEISQTSRMAMYRKFSWCWQVPVPQPVQTGEIYDQVFIDGTYLHGGWVLLIACTATHILNWQLAARENSAAYTELLSPIAPPLMVVTDGAKGALQAITRLWPDTRIQRCLVHVQRQNFRDLTRSPQTTAGVALLELSRRLTRIDTIEQANTWMNDLNTFHQVFGDYIKERTYAKDVPEHARQGNKKWWYTHGRDRSVYMRLKHLLHDKQLFAYLSEDHKLHSSTNIVEGRNAAIKRLYDLHRGWDSYRQIQAAFHYLNNHSETPYTPRQILKKWRQTGQENYTLIPAAPTRPTPPAPTINEHAPWEDGLTIRQG